jgi:hypothetical protein
MDQPRALVHPASTLESATEALAPKRIIRPPQRPVPTRRLPTERIKFSSQLDIIRAYGAASQNGSRAVNYREAAKYVKLDPATVSLINPFLVENGFAERVGNDVLPSRAVVDFAMAHTWAAETASRKLRPIIERAWFGVTLRSKLAFNAMSEDEAIRELANEIAAPPEFKPRLALLIDYAEAAGLLRREGNQLLLMAHIVEDSTAASAESAPHERSESGDPPRLAGARSSGSVGTGFMSTEGAIQFHVSIRVTMQEMAGWSPDRITAFFAGLAQVLAAKKGTEEI